MRNITNPRYASTDVSRAGFAGACEEAVEARDGAPGAVVLGFISAGKLLGDIVVGPDLRVQQGVVFNNAYCSATKFFVTFFPDRDQNTSVETIARFDEAAAQWDNNPVRVALARAIGSVIQNTIPIQPGWRAMDFGAGTGLLTLNIQPQVASVLALDTSRGMLEQLDKKLAGTRITNVHTLEWNLEAQPLNQNGFDLIVSSMTLHHLRDVRVVFQRLASLLNPGGWIACADLDKEDGSFHGEAADVFHKGFERAKVKEWLESAGFRNVSVRDAHSVMKPSSNGEMRSYSVFLVTGQKA